MDKNKLENKLDNVRTWINLVGEKNYRIGFPYYNQKFRKRPKLFNQINTTILLLTIFIRDFVSFFITDRYYTTILGNFLHGYKYEIHFKLGDAIAIIMAFVNQFISRLQINGFQEIIEKTDFDRNVLKTNENIKL